MILMGAIICLVWYDNITHFSSIPRILVIYASPEANDRDKEMYSLIDGSGIDDGAVPHLSRGGRQPDPRIPAGRYLLL